MRRVRDDRVGDCVDTKVRGGFEVDFAESCLSCNPKNPVQNARRRGKAICIDFVFPAVCGLRSRSPCTFPTPRAMAFRDVPGGVPVTPRPFAALTGAPLSRGEFCAFFAVLIMPLPSVFRPPSSVLRPNPRSAVCRLRSHSSRTFPKSRAMAFRGVPGVRARHTPPVRCAHPGTPLERGILRVLRRRYIAVSHCLTSSVFRPPSSVLRPNPRSAVCGQRSAVCGQNTQLSPSSFFRRRCSMKCFAFLA
ncbi:hypothetical protein CYPRO_2493 [Cyclonatronum proteinivorum]|uniref:Uncharacterized protein n=1 Tax=Cyclonatronum proteinivorum TaxID=1457365 RepID=A0A345UMN3_9BACT|nr:hypothetical protein CYPRO_2493 [Cyclonatronum proteinivorum]